MKRTNLAKCGDVDFDPSSCGNFVEHTGISGDGLIYRSPNSVDGLRDKMLCVKDFFAACIGRWKTERIYHYPQQGEVDRSYTEFNVEILTSPEKHQISSAFIPGEFFRGEKLIEQAYVFAIGFETKSETGEAVSMRLKALFVPDSYIVYSDQLPKDPAAPGQPLAADVTYQRPAPKVVPSVITLVGFGLERREE
jgi:hypothetical protein